jgi:hypothetical protein
MLEEIPLSSKTLAAVVAGAALSVALAAACNRPLPAGPEPSPEPTPSPTPAPTPTPIYGCGLPRGTGNGANCPRESPTFQGQLDAAIDKVIAEHPNWFDLNSGRGPSLPAIRRPDLYAREVVDNLRRAGLCAFNDGEEIAVKNSNAFNDQFDIITADGVVRRSYRTTCYPAWEAIPPAAD